MQIKNEVRQCFYSLDGQLMSATMGEAGSQESSWKRVLPPFWPCLNGFNFSLMSVTLYEEPHVLKSYLFLPFPFPCAVCGHSVIFQSTFSLNFPEFTLRYYPLMSNLVSFVQWISHISPNFILPCFSISGTLLGAYWEK